MSVALVLNLPSSITLRRKQIETPEKYKKKSVQIN